MRTIPKVLTQKIYLQLIVISLPLNAMAQTDELPYASIPNPPTEYSAGKLAARIIDGLGYRYYWATEGLRSQDLDYRPSEKGRSTLETVDHIYGLTMTILSTASHQKIERPEGWRDWSFNEKRKATLLNIQKAGLILRNVSDAELDTLNIWFAGSDKVSNLPFWNLVNGMISDSIYHVGQVVSFRRTSGNPMDPNVNVLLGKTNR